MKSDIFRLHYFFLSTSIFLEYIIFYCQCCKNSSAGNVWNFKSSRQIKLVDMCVCVCVCVCVFVCLYPFIVQTSSVCNDAWEILKGTILCCGYYAGGWGPSSPYLSPPKTKTPASTNQRENNIMYCTGRKMIEMDIGYKSAAN